MAYGLHWEWRAFGSLTPRFAQTYLELPVHYQSHQVTDDYLWIPGLEVNAKFRTGAEDGLKFKRIKKKEAEFEVWLEDEDELFEFPLEREAWHTLCSMLKEVDIPLPDYPSSPPSRRYTSFLLEESGCKIVTVTKERETRVLEINGHHVLVEWAVITAPQACISIGLETWSGNPDTDLSGRSALQTIKQAISELELEHEPLRAMNYLEAVKLWAEGSKI